MVGRKCPGCGKIRFSADSGRPWVCDNCGTGIPAEAQVPSGPARILGRPALEVALENLVRFGYVETEEAP